MKIKIIAVVVLAFSLRLVSATEAADQSYAGEIYADATATNSLFQVERSWRINDNKTVLNESFKDSVGKTVASLQTTYIARRLAFIQFEQKQAGETATAEFKDGRVFYSTTINGKIKTSDADASGEWVAFNAVPEYISQHWEKLVQGDAVYFRMPVPVMRDSFGFSLTRTRTWTVNGQKRSEFKLESSSALIRLLADPMFYVFNDSDRALIEFRGRTIVKLNIGGKLKDLDATIKYRQQNQ